MFDVNPAAHGYHLRDIDRAFAVRGHPSRRTARNAGVKRPSALAVIAGLFLTLTLATAISGGLTF